MCWTTSESGPRHSGPDKWVVVRQVFITRLKEQRYPTREELDRAAPEEPRAVLDRPGRLAQLAGPETQRDRQGFPARGSRARSRSTRPPASRPASSATSPDTSRRPHRGVHPRSRSEDQRLLELFADYNSVGLTAVIDRNADAQAVDRYRRLLEAGALTIRLGVSHGVDQPRAPSTRSSRRSAGWPSTRSARAARCSGSSASRLFLDGGMLTGSAYMREPWGVSRDLLDRRPELSRRAVHPAGAPRADGPGGRRVGPPVHGPQRRRRRRARPARRLRGGRTSRRPSRPPGRASPTRTS